MTAEASSSTTGCVSQPLSWLVLEQHALGELPAARATQVHEHLARCPACQQCFARITATPAIALPPLSARARAQPRPAAITVAPAAVPPPARPARAPGRWRWRWPVLGAGLATATVAAAAAALLLLAPGPPLNRRPGETSKGLAVTLTLLRERAGAVAEDPPGYLPDDRWKALVTCPGGQALSWALLLFHEGLPAERIADGRSLPCGNRVPLPDAFRLTGPGTATVCFMGVAGDQPPPAPAAARPMAELEQAGAACVRVTRETP